MTTFVEVGSVVKYVEWEAVPDKYAGPRIFSDPADAAKYAQETYGRVNVLATFPEGTLSIAQDVAAGDVVQRVAYRLQAWRDMTVREQYDDLQAAIAAVPAGRTIGVYQVLWIGAPGTDGVPVVGDTLEVTGTVPLTVVPQGSVVQEVVWEGSAERYNPTREFSTRAEAEEYAEANYGSTNLVLTFPEGRANFAGPEWPSDEPGPQPGEVVQRVAYKVRLSPPPGDYKGDEPMLDADQLEAARAAVPAGRSGWVYQELWIGPRELHVFGAVERVKGEQND